MLNHEDEQPECWIRTDYPYFAAQSLTIKKQDEKPLSERN